LDEYARREKEAIEGHYYWVLQWKEWERERREKEEQRKNELIEMTKRKHDDRFYKDLALIEKAERMRKQGFSTDVAGSVHCLDCGKIGWPLDDPEVEARFVRHKQEECEQWQVNEMQTARLGK